MKSITIYTSHQIPISYEAAGFTARFLSFLIDFFIIYLLYAFIFLSGLYALGEKYSMVLLIVISVLFSVYSLITETLLNGQTPGKKALGIKVIKINGEKMNFIDYFIRWTFRLIDIYLTLGSVATLLINASEKKQRLGDIIAFTTVIKLRPSKRILLKEILSITSASDYSSTYLFVKDFTEEEMLMIKELLDRKKEFPSEVNEEIIEELVVNIIKKYKIQKPANNEKFLATLIKDYVVLTR